MAHVLIIGAPTLGIATGVLTVTLFASVTFAAETLEEAWDRALRNDDALAAAAADLESAMSDERAARASRWPMVTGRTAYTRFDAAPELQLVASGFTLASPIFDGDDYASGSIHVSVPIYTGGRISADIRAARQTTLGALDAVHTARSALRLDVAQSYVDVLRAKRSLLTAETSVASLSAHVRDVQQMVERELVARNDLLAARVALANAQQQRVRAENRLALAYATYNRRLGEELDRTPALAENIPVDTVLAAQPLESLVERAFESRAELSAVSARAEALALRSRAERAGLLPQLSISGGYTYFENQILDRQDFSSVGLGLTWTLFDGGRARHRSAALRSASAAERRRVADLRTQIELQVRQAWLDVREARARVMASREAVAEAGENLRISRELYSTGLGTNTQVLEAVALHVAAANNRDEAVLDESLALLRLAHAVGVL